MPTSAKPAPTWLPVEDKKLARWAGGGSDGVACEGSYVKGNSSPNRKSSIHSEVPGLAIFKGLSYPLGLWYFVPGKGTAKYLERVTLISP